MLATKIRFSLVINFLCILCSGLYGQGLEQADIAKIIVDGIELSNPLAGGLNAPQLSNVDFDNDGVDDVLIFDRIGGVVLPLLHEGDQYIYDPSYAINFPKVDNFLLMKDFNNDGIADIFCYSVQPGSPGISAYIGKYTDGRIDFDLVVSQNPTLPSVINFQLSNNSFANIAVLNTDIPSIEDIDGDGDLDIVTFNFLGGQIEYYQNLVVERNESLDNFFFIKADDCYGGAYESGLSEIIALAENNGECATGLTGDGVLETRHAGSTVLSMDFDADGDFEVLLGDLSFNNITLLVNGGDEEDAFFTEQIVNYPDEAEEPVDIPIFPGAFYADVDGDGINDFIAAPNNINSSLDTDNVWFYKNNGANNLPVFNLESKSLFVEDMLDLGTGTSPTFVDLNGDGLLDMVVGTETTYVSGGDRDGRLYLFLNIGTDVSPEFELIDDNWLNFQRFNNDAFLFDPTFADTDSDGDMDLYVGERNGNIYFAENLGGEDQYLNFGPIVPNYLSIDIGQESSPFLYDVDGDGLLDMLIGERLGNINYLKNIGSATSPDFDSYVPNLETDPPAEFNLQSLGQIDTRIPGVTIVGNSKPRVIEVEDKTYIVSGSVNGALEVYLLDDDLESEFDLIDDNFGDLAIGWTTSPAFADLNNDGILEVMIGNKRGGLSGFTNVNIESVSTNQSVSDSSDFKLLQNLVRNRVVLADDLNADIKVFSTLGQLEISKDNINSIDVSHLIPGIYFINIEKGGLGNTLKFVKH